MEIAREYIGCNKQPHYLELKLTDGSMRIWILTKEILRVEWSPQNDFRQHSYQLLLSAWDDVTDGLFASERTRIEPLSYEVTEEANILEVHSIGFDIHIQKKPFGLSIMDAVTKEKLQEDIYGAAYRRDNNQRLFHMVSRDACDHFYGFGEKTGPVDKTGMLMKEFPSDAMGYDALQTDPLYKHIPFFIRYNSDQKVTSGIFYHNANPCEFDMGKGRCNYYPPHYSYETDGGNIDYFVFRGRNANEILDQYTRLTGRPAMLPRYALGYLGSSMYYAELPNRCDQAIEKFVDTASDEGIPMDGFQLSSGYTTYQKKRCVFFWDQKRFPEPKDFFEKMSQRHIHVSCNVKPALLTIHPRLKEFMSADIFLHKSQSKTPVTGAWWGGEGYYVDFTRPAARQKWKEELKSALLEQGADSIWNDNCEYDGMLDEDVRCDVEGTGGTLAENRVIMANLMCFLAKETIMEKDSMKRPYIVCRAGSSGIGHYAQTWAGDNNTSWESLAGNIATILGMGLSGVPNNGCDIGGFYGKAPSEELLRRWVQSAVFMPRFSIHSCNTDNTVTEPWMYPTMTPLIRQAINLRYQLMPHLYSLMYLAHLTGQPMMQSLQSVFCEDENCQKENINFMFGDSLLVASVTKPKIQEMPVYFPKNEIFYDLYSTKVYLGGNMVSVGLCEDHIPLFLKAGGMLLLADATVEEYQQTNERGPADYFGEPKRLRIVMAPAKSGSMVFYEDDGNTNAYEQGEYCINTLSMEVDDRKEQVVFSVARQGNYVSAIERIQMEVICDTKSPLHVLLNTTEGSRELVRYMYQPEFFLEQQVKEAEGWFYNPQTKRSEIIFVRPRSDFQVVISFEMDDLIKM